MILNFFKPIKKFIPRSTAIKKLRVTNKQFDELVMLCAIYPILPTQRNSIKIEDGWYYQINDIRKIYFSEAYDVLYYNRGNRERKEKYLRFNRTDKLQCFQDEELGLVSLVKNKYQSFGEALSALGESVTNLYLLRMFSNSGSDRRIDDAKSDRRIDDTKSDKRITDDAKNDKRIDDKNSGSDNNVAGNDITDNKVTGDQILQKFENFVTRRGMLNFGFLSLKGVYFSCECERINLVWLYPYPGTNLEDFVEEKKEIEKKLKSDVLVFLEDFGDSEETIECDESEGDDNKGDKADSSSRKEDISLLKYAEPLLIKHIELALYKYEKLYGEDRRREGLFKGKKVSVSVGSVYNQVELVLRNEEAEIVEESRAEIVYTALADRIHPGVVYCHPQHVFDSLNQKVFLSPEKYQLGRELPAHNSPFSDPYELLNGKMVGGLSNKKRNQILDRIEKLN